MYGLAIPEPYGHSSVSARCYAMVTEEISRGWMSLAGAFGGHSVVSKLLVRFGTDEQRERYLPRMATGELRATMAARVDEGPKHAVGVAHDDDRNISQLESTIGAGRFVLA